MVWNVVFTDRNCETVHAKEREYKTQFPDVEIIGYHIDSLINETTVDEESVKKMFAELDSKDIFIETLVLNAADQGLNII